MNHTDISSLSRRSALLLSVGCWLGAASAGAAEPDATQLLRQADQARGGGFPGLIWEVQAHNSGSQADDQPDDNQNDQHQRDSRQANRRRRGGGRI